MENKPFVEAYEDINSRMIRLVGSMTALRKLSDLERSLVDESALLQQSLQILMENHELELAVVFLQQQGRLQQVAMQQWQEKPQPLRVPALDNLASLAARSFASASVESQQDMTLGDVSSPAICLPLISGEECTGALCVCSADTDFFTAAHERSLQIYCNFLTQSLVNNRLLRRMEGLVQERTERLQAALDEAHALQQRYQELAIIDPLTGLHNRRFFFPEACTLIAAALRYQKPLSLLLLDLDRLKQVNESGGYDAGDQLLRDVAQLLQKDKREADILARFGGEEFVMILPQTDVAGASDFAGRVCEHLQAQVSQLTSGPDDISVSTGLSSLRYPATISTQQVLDYLLRQAGTALLHAKEQGGNRVSHYADIDRTIV